MCTGSACPPSAARALGFVAPGAHDRPRGRLLPRPAGFLSVVPGGTALGVILFVYAGGIITFVAWLAGAAAALRLGIRSRTTVAATAVDEPA